MFALQLFAKPWWVNLLLLIPALAYSLWHKNGLRMRLPQLVHAMAFAFAFGFVEAAVVVYLRAAVGLLPGYQGTLADVQRHAMTAYQQQKAIESFPQSLLTVEVLREAATMIMLVAVALMAAPRWRERWALFLWMFALWDAAYYSFLWMSIRWPASLADMDVLFLIPEPWLAPVWFPLLVSGLTVLAVGFGCAKRSQT
jgi:hypothetical protein